jgi:transposase-like protein
MSSPREDRGLEIAKSNVISENVDGSFSVPSQTVGEVVYLVRAIEGGYSCNCPDWTQRHVEIGSCKHIHAVRFWVALRVELQAEPKPKVFADDAVLCAKCGSIRVVKNGTKRQKQVFRCKDCGHKFAEQSLLRGSRYTPEMVSLTLDLYFSGTSLRKTARILNNHFGLNLVNSTVHKWIQKFVPKVAEYVNSLTPELSETWHADELFVKMKGGETEKQYGQTSMAYLWNVMDRKTRFLIASTLTAHRDVGAADRAFREAKAHAHDRLPETVLTDGLKAYRDAVKFGFPDAVHVAKAGIKRQPAATNNRVERLNGTLRERVKVERGWKTMKTSLAEGQRIHYNFVKPHAALEGQTPAERANVGVGGQDKWLSLLRASLAQRSEPEN